MSALARVSDPATQPRSAGQKNTSAGPTSKWTAASCAILSGKPPWVWTAPFGLPVVPDV